MKRINLCLTVISTILAVVLSLVLIDKRSQEKTGVSDDVEVRISQEGNTYVAKKIKVMAGNEFDITLDNGKRIHAKLAVNSVPDAKHKVITYLNQTTNPKVVVLGKQGDIWIIDLYVRKELQASLYEEISLTSWLKDSGLIWQYL
ncbi:MAG: hypothetical protein ACW99G_03015 [Candidatus Thorarchaeota archaeon]|jgi:hypothetical protein